VWIASDDYLFIADFGNNRVQVLTPNFDMHDDVGVGQLSHPSGVCASDDVVVVSEFTTCRIKVFNRRDGTIRRLFGSPAASQAYPDGDAAQAGGLETPRALCFVSDSSHVAVADGLGVSVFRVDCGTFIRRVGTFKCAIGVACSAFGELVVAACFEDYICVFDADCDLSTRIELPCSRCCGVAIHGGTIFALQPSSAGGAAKCLTFGAQ
jgi:sugar lactone lactonase YvrE